MKHFRIGSAPDNHVVINQPGVSPYHLDLVDDASGAVYVRDLNSQYGTYVNGVRLQGSVMLRPNDVVTAYQSNVPWQTYFATPVTPPAQQPPAYTSNPVPPPPVYATPVQSPNPVQQPVVNPVQPAGTAFQPAEPAPKKSKKKLFIILGCSLLGLVAIGALFLYLYTRSSDAHLRFIPKNSFVVASVNFKSLASKVDVEAIKNSELFKDMSRELDKESGKMADAMSNPMSSGIDIFSQPYIFVTYEHVDYDQFTGGVAFGLKNAADFASFMESANHDHSIETSGNFNFMRLDGHMCVAWNKDGGVFLGSDRSSSDMKDYCRTLLDQPEKESILGNDNFKKFRNATYDIGVYLNYDGIRNLARQNFPDWAAGSAAIMSVNFDNGKLSYSTEFVPGPAGAGSYPAFFKPSGINSALQKSVPAGTYGIAAMSLNMQALHDYLAKDPNGLVWMNEASGAMGISDNDLAGILSGDFYIALTDLKQKIATHQVLDYENYDPYYGGFSYKTETDTTIEPQFLVGFTVKDQKNFEAVLAQMGGRSTDSAGIRTWTTGYYERKSYYLSKNGENYFFSNDLAMAGMLSQNGAAGTPLSGTAADVISSNPMGVYMNLNINKYPAFMPDYFRHNIGSRDYEPLSEFLTMCDYVTLKSNAQNQNFDLYFVDKNNCLNAIYAHANAAYLKAKNH